MINREQNNDQKMWKILIKEMKETKKEINVIIPLQNKNKKIVKNNRNMIEINPNTKTDKKSIAKVDLDKNLIQDTDNVKAKENITIMTQVKIGIVGILQFVHETNPNKTSTEIDHDKNLEINHDSIEKNLPVTDLDTSHKTIEMTHETIGMNIVIVMGRHINDITANNLIIRTRSIKVISEEAVQVTHQMIEKVKATKNITQTNNMINTMTTSPIVEKSLTDTNW